MNRLHIAISAFISIAFGRKYMYCDEYVRGFKGNWHDVLRFQGQISKGLDDELGKAYALDEAKRILEGTE